MGYATKGIHPNLLECLIQNLHGVEGLTVGRVIRVKGETVCHVGSQPSWLDPYRNVLHKMDIYTYGDITGEHGKILAVQLWQSYRLALKYPSFHGWR